MHPLVSIIVPVYNVDNYLCRCLDSIKSQTYTEFEAILVDDGSSDLSGEICEEYARKDCRFMVVHKQNQGVAKARITAFEQSKGDLITFIDADDYVDTHYLEKLAKPILEDDADMVSCNYFDVFSSDVKPSPLRLTGTFENINDFISNHYFYDKSIRREGMTRFLWTKMVKRQYVCKGLQDGLGLWFGEDQIGVFSMLYRINKLSLLSERLYYYVHYKEQTSKRYDFTLWQSIISMLEMYSILDINNIAEKAIRKRSWDYVNQTIFSKIANTNISNKDFRIHLSKVRSFPYLESFFNPFYIESGARDNLKYWFLKLRLFSVFYFIYVKRKQIHKDKDSL